MPVPNCYIRGITRLTDNSADTPGRDLYMKEAVPTSTLLLIRFVVDYIISE